MNALVLRLEEKLASNPRNRLFLEETLRGVKKEVSAAAFVDRRMVVIFHPGTDITKAAPLAYRLLNALSLRAVIFDFNGVAVTFQETSS